MSNYGIMRIEKRGRASLYGLQIEANRTLRDHESGRDFDNSDIDWTKTKDNIHIIHTVSWSKEVTRQIKQYGLKERKDSIVLLDALYTASPEWFQTHTKREMLEYFRDCLQFHIREYCGGDKSLLINAVIHLDETTPHMAVASLPIITDEKGPHLSAKIIMGNREDYRLRQDRFYDEVSGKYGMERGEPKRPEEVKSHTAKREWQLATQERQINDLLIQKELLEFDISSLKAARKYEHNKAEETKQLKTDIQNQIEELQNKNNELQQKNEELYNSRYEEFKKYKQGTELRQKLETEIKELSEKQNQLKEYISRNSDMIRNWKSEVESKINSINEAVDEYKDFSNEMEQQYSKDIMDYVLNALGDVPEEPEAYCNQPETEINNYNYDEEEYEL